MTRLKQNLYLTFSNQKARELKRSGELRAFDEVTTLSTLIQETFEKHHFETIIDDVLGSSIVHHIIAREKIEYFSYLKSGDESLSTIFDFIVKCQRNGVVFDTLISGEKLQALQQIDDAYQVFKKVHNLVDMADVERTILEEWDGTVFEKYETVYVDSFRVGDINFIESKYQVMLLEKLRECPAFESVKEKHSTVTLVKPSEEVFDVIDEVKTALKIVRKLLEEGEDAEEILIVASDIEEYAPLYKLFLDEYGLKGYSSAGTSLGAFHNDAHPKVRQSLQTYEKEMKTLSLRYEKMGLELTQTLKEQLKASVKIADEKIGIEMTEPNQLVGLNRSYKHIIFIGTDINHFPPQAQDNFLYSYEDALQHFHANDYFASSKTQYDELKRLGDNLYIITAGYSDKRKLEPSIVIDKEIKECIDVGDIQGLSDLALTGQTVMPDAHTKAYYESIESETLTAFDGLGVEGVKADHLSASQINKYLACPLAYLFDSKLKLQAPDTTEEGFDVMQQGSLMHLCYELFGKAIRDTQNRSTDTEELYALMFEVSEEAYKDEKIVKDRGIENIHHKIFLSTLQAGLKDEREAGLLAKFVDYYIAHAEEFSYFQHTAFEKEFLLDAELKPYERKYEEDYDYFIRGFIDRLDNLPDRVNVIDYKSKKMAGKTDKKKMEQVETLKDVQLALYLLYVKSVYPDKEYYAHLLSFKGDNPYYHFANLSSVEEKNSVLFDEGYEERLKTVVFETKSNIEAGNFGFDSSDEEACGWCDYRRICHQEVLEKGR